MSKILPLPHNVDTNASLASEDRQGMSASFGDKTIHFLAAEPHATFLRVRLMDGEQHVAFETVVLGRLRFGYRVFQLRNLLGTRIELCYLFVRISFHYKEPNVYLSRRRQERRAQRVACAPYID